MAQRQGEMEGSRTFPDDELDDRRIEGGGENGVLQIQSEHPQVGGDEALTRTRPVIATQLVE